MGHNDDDDNNKAAAGSVATASAPPPGNNDAAAACMIFSADLAKRLSTTELRLPPTYVGVRRVRPSSFAVRDAFVEQGNKNASSSSNKNGDSADKVVFKIVDPETGQERRMTAREKKLAKQQRALEKKERKKLEKQKRVKEKEEKEKELKLKAKKEKKEKTGRNEKPGTKTEPKSLKRARTNNSVGEKDKTIGNDDKYMPFNINQSALEQEVADLRGERDGVPPVVLNPAMARLAPFVVPQHSSASLAVVVNDEISQQWAKVLKQAMAPAEHTRRQEDMRQMVYDLVPEVWSRRRPASLGGSADEGNSSVVKEQKDQSSCSDVKGVVQQEAVLPSTTTSGSGKSAASTTASAATPSGPVSWAPCTIRPPFSSRTFDSHLATVAAVLHTGTNLHLACGSKFGCDFLLYDSPRTQVHAFAGLRVLESSSSPVSSSPPATAATDSGSSSSSNSHYRLPVPTAYDMTGYVRCLNTAGKLALLATVVPSKDGKRQEVAFVDLSLIKIAPTGKARRLAKRTEEQDKK